MTTTAARTETTTTDGSRPGPHPTGRPRYDGLADWYDAEMRRLALTATAIEALTRLLGPGPGRCLDLGCGTGLALPAVAGLGWRVTGTDLSRDQLRLAGERAGGCGAALVLADAASLPFPGGAFDAVVSLFTHTDLDDPRRVAAEAARVLRPGGRLIDVGTHPCFVAPFAERPPRGPILLHPGYRARGWYGDGPGFSGGIRDRVGAHHLPLAGLVGAFLDAGLALVRLEEPGDDDYPFLLALVLER
jgi:SAM-dependent methyltransferase